MNHLSQSAVLDVWNSIHALNLTEKVLKFHQLICPEPISETAIEQLDVPTATTRLLQRNGIKTIEQLKQMTWGELLILKGVGEGKAFTIRRALERLQ